MIADETLKRTPLYEEHLALQAKMVPFGGWAMPVQYEGILAEYQQTRTAVTVFDTSHMGEFMIEGDCLKSGLDYLVTMLLVDMPVKTCRYGMMLNTHGGVIDDLVVFRVDQEKWFMVVNAATTTKDAEHLQKNLHSKAVFKNISEQTGKLDVQGLHSREVLRKLIPGIAKLNYFTFDYFDFFKENVLVSRTGYTGELGYEVYCPWAKTKGLWQMLLKNKSVRPAGLGARDVLRLEVGYSLYGHEINEAISPLEAGLERFIDFKKDFMGKEALLRQKQEGIKRRLIGFVSDTRRTPRANHYIYSESQETIGAVTSGTFSPHLNRGIGLGFVDSAHGRRAEKIFFGDDRNKMPAVITAKTFYRAGSLKS